MNFDEPVKYFRVEYFGVYELSFYFLYHPKDTNVYVKIEEFSTNICIRPKFHPTRKMSIIIDTGNYTEDLRLATDSELKLMEIASDNYYKVTLLCKELMEKFGGNYFRFRSEIEEHIERFVHEIIN